MCGYAVEVALKARICKTLRWSGFPETNAEFQSYRSFQTHNLEVLLHLAGRESQIKTQFIAEWSAVTTWDPEARYRAVGKATVTDLQLMVKSARTLLRVL